MINIAIVDDEKEQLNTIREKTQAWFDSNEKVCGISVFDDPKLFRESYTPSRYDLIFLDIDMKPVNGMSIAKHIRKTGDPTTIVFITNLARFALKGYEVQAFDFIVKPVVDNVFYYKMNRIVSFCERNQKNMIPIRLSEKTLYVDECEIYYVECLNHYLVYHTARGNFTEWNTLKKVMESLSKTRFALCNRGYLVNLSYVDALKLNSVVVHGEELLISRSRKKEFFEAVSKYRGR